MDLLTLISLVASIASLILAVLAIALSIIFFILSAYYSEKSNAAANKISSTVDRLEKLFDHLYADTFSMMRENVTEMQKHAWPKDNPVDNNILIEADRRADSKVETLKESTAAEMRKLLELQSGTHEAVSRLSTDMEGLLGRAIDNSRQLDESAREETIREHIIATYRRLRKASTDPITLFDIYSPLVDIKLQGPDILAEYHRMLEDESLRTNNGRSDSNAVVMYVKGAD